MAMSLWKLRGIHYASRIFLANNRHLSLSKLKCQLEEIAVIPKKVPKAKFVKKKSNIVGESCQQNEKKKKSAVLQNIDNQKEIIRQSTVKQKNKQQKEKKNLSCFTRKIFQQEKNQTKSTVGQTTIKNKSLQKLDSTNILNEKCISSSQSEFKHTKLFAIQKKYKDDMLKGFSLTSFDKLLYTDQLCLLYFLNRERNKTIKFTKKEKSIFEDSLRSYLDKIKVTNSFRSYIQVSIMAGFLENVTKMLISLLKKDCLADATGINLVMQAIYSQDNSKLFEEVCLHLDSSTNILDVTTYALIFQCLGKFDYMKNSQIFTTNFLKLMKSENISVEELFKNALFVSGNTQDAEKALAIIGENVNYSEDTVNLHRYTDELLAPLNSTLFKSNENSILDGVINKEEWSRLFHEQIELEKKGKEEVKLVWPPHLNEKHIELSEQGHIWHQQWKSQILNAYREHKKILYEEFAEKKFKGLSIYPFYCCLEEEDFVELLLDKVDELACLPKAYSRSTKYISRMLGRSIAIRCQRMANVNDRLAKISQAYQQFIEWHDNNSVEAGGRHPSVKWELALQKTKAREVVAEAIGWSTITEKNIGQIFLNLLLNNITIEVEIDGEIIKKQAFLKVLRHDSQNNLVYQVQPCEELLKDRDTIASHKLPCEALPMLCPPVPWTAYNNGGYLLEKLQMYRSEVSSQQMYFSEVSNITPILDGLTLLGMVPWMVNIELLDIITKIFHDGGDEHLKIPLQDEKFSESLQTPKTSANYIHKIKMTQENRKKQGENFALWMECLQKLSFAHKYKDRTYWLPQSVDFRGRAYPIPYHLSQVSSDLYRSLLLFAKGKKLGTEGLRWLKIHVVNLTGKQKRNSLEERLQYCEDHLDDIFDSADNPLDGNRWWTEGDDQWQCLAACKELTKALRSESPENYINHLPIHQDGSCNGLQHYAGVGRDSIGAAAVNLKPSMYPQDVYSKVLDIVIEIAKKDILKKNKVAEKILPLLVRKTIKQTVMTSVYGVTSYGASQQIEKQLKETFSHEGDKKKAARYITVATFEALKQMFSSAKEIQTWLTKTAQYICKEKGEPVSWITPLGLPVTQPYFTNSTSLQFKKRPVGLKQCNAFPPNFIHSLDSTHMFLTAMHCYSVGVTFAAIHDCFWTHAADINELSYICREQFAHLYSQPIIEDLKNNFDESFPPLENQIADLVLPSKGDFDINEVKKSDFFFS